MSPMATLTRRSSAGNGVNLASPTVTCVPKRADNIFSIAGLSADKLKT